MTLPCDPAAQRRLCPFVACPVCEWQGGVNPAAAEADTRAKESDRDAPAWDNGDADEAAPTGVRQHSNRGLTTGTSPSPLRPRR